MEIGADSIICGTSGLSFVSAVAHADIPTEGHLRLVPRRDTWTGGLRAVGKTIDQAVKLYEDLIALKKLGVLAVEIEVMLSTILNILTNTTSLVTSSIGGDKGDIQFLFAEIFWAIFLGHIPDTQNSVRVKTQEMRPMR